MVISQILSGFHTRLCFYHRLVLLRNQSSFSSGQIRKTFLDFHERMGYIRGSSSSLVPFDDMSLQFVNSGMVPLKKYFLAPVSKSNDKSWSLSNCQKCIRAGGKHNDFSEIGTSPRHLTFFEMLGSWSFNSHLSPKQICTDALTMLTQGFNIPQNQLSVTYFGGDESKQLPVDENCIRIWQDLGFETSQISPGNMKDNFWAMGTGGPCGPCTEIHFKANDSDQPIELWNIVFIRYNMLSYGTLKKLGTEHIDTGMGLERLATFLQTGGSCVYDSDIFQSIIQHIAKLYTRPDLADGKFVDVDARIVADHSRAITAAVADGVAPGSHGASYLVRKLIRHAAYRGALLANQDISKAAGILPELCKGVIETMADVYPEMEIESNNVVDTVFAEEKRFLTSLSSGKKRWAQTVQSKGGNLKASDLFSFYSVNGFPLDVITHLCQKDNIEFKLDEFETELERHIHKSNANSQSASSKKNMNIAADNLRAEGVPETDVSPNYQMTRSPDGKYQLPMTTAKVVALVCDNAQLTQAVPIMEQCYLVLDKTPFYAVGGGQVSDTGRIRYGSNMFIMDKNKNDAVQVFGGYVFHRGRFALGGSFSIGNEISSMVDMPRRLGCMQHHTATHLIAAALERVLATSVKQRSSLITKSFARFGFWTTSQIIILKLCEKLENTVNDWIEEGHEVRTEFIPKAELTKTKHLRYLLAEAYPDPFRAIRIGPKHGSMISLEACGGTHVQSLKDLIKLRITDWKSKGSGEVSITVVAGQSALDATVKGTELIERLRECPDPQLFKRDVIIPLSDKLIAKQLIKENTKSNHKSFEQIK